MKLNHSIKRKFQRILIDSKRHHARFNPNLKFEFEEETLQICRSLILLPETKLIICPLTGQKFISNAELKILAVLFDNKIIVSNKPHFKETLISTKGLKSINQIFDSHLLNSINELNKIVKNNQQENLTNTKLLISFLRS